MAILITGATGFFGKTFVDGLHRDFEIVAAGRSEKKLSELKNKWGVKTLCFDAYDLERTKTSLFRLFETIEITGLINNAYDLSEKTGFNILEGRFEDLSIERMQNAMTSGLLSPLVVTQSVLSQMIQKKIKGSIVNISSMYGEVAPDKNLYEGKEVFNPVTYGVTKSGLNGLTRYVASFFGEYGIRCNGVAPGAFPNIDQNSKNCPGDDQEFFKRLERKTTLGRVGTPSDLVGIVKLLLSKESEYITGQTIGVDGGWTAI